MALPHGLVLHIKKNGMSSNGMGYAISISGPFPPLGKLGTRKSPGIEIVGCVDQCVQAYASAIL